MKSLFIATPCYGGLVNVQYMESVVQLIMLCAQQNIKVNFFKIPFESLISRARNVCASAFLQSGFSHMIFIDSDIEFKAIDVINLLNADEDIIGGMYPTKKINYSELKEKVSESTSYQELISKSVNYTSQGVKNPVKKNICESDYIATGFMMIKREVFLKLIKQKPEIKYKNDIPAYTNYTYNDYMYDFFQTKIINEKYVSEDYGFCYLWKEIGGKIYSKIDINLNHIGSMVYYGCPINKYQLH